MDLLLCLYKSLSDFCSLFNQQNFALFQSFIIGFVANSGGGTLTSLYQSSCSETRYRSFVKFLSRGKWNADAIAAHLIKRIRQEFLIWVYIYDGTKAIKTGTTQWGLHFFRNFSFQRRPINQSKYQFGALAFLRLRIVETLFL